MALLLVLVGACSNDNFLQMIQVFEKTTLVVELEPGVGKKAIYPNADLDVAYFDISGTGPDGASFSEVGYASSLFSQSGLAAGEWTISAVAKNAAGTVVGASPLLTVNLEKANQTHARLVCKAPNGNGFYAISIYWPPGTISDANLTTEMVSQTGQRHQVEFSKSYSKVETIGLPELPAGLYRLELQVSDKNFTASALWRKTEDILIREGFTTEIEYSLSMEDLDLQPGARTFAGSSAQNSFDGLGTQAAFNYPSAIAIDSNGNMYVADTQGNRIRKITPDGQVSTLAGGGGPDANGAGFQDGLGTAAAFKAPEGIAIGSSGTILVADTGNHAIRSVTSQGYVVTLAGNGTPGSTEGQGGIDGVARFNSPRGLVRSGIYTYVADTVNNKIRRISGTTVSTFAGSGSAAWADGNTTSASFNQPSGLAVDVNGYLYVADTQNYRIRTISPNGFVSTLAGGAAPGAVDGLGAGASFRSPRGVAVGEAGIIYIADTGNNKLRRISPGGAVTTIAGTGATLWQDGPLLECSFSEPRGLASGGSGRIFVADSFNYRIRLVLIR
jgi:hypothetical protein